MAITAVFLDLYQTLAYFHPSRETRQLQALKDFGFEADFKAICAAYLRADYHYTLAGQERPIHLRSEQEREEIYLRFQRFILEDLGLSSALPLVREIRDRYATIPREFTLYPDVIPAVRQLSDAGYRVGVITNVTDDPSEVLQKAGLGESLASITASCVTGCEKPDRRIFQAALDSLGASAGEAVHVGDQLHADVEGARGAGMRAVLLDRFDVQADLYPHRITTLLDLVPLLRSGALDQEE